ncbi:MAG: hypothetical protein GY795_39340 [Desulfobacterales bacterium]|nr:hypothetical protein [Desulfobacterales bacterium]
MTALEVNGVEYGCGMEWSTNSRAKFPDFGWIRGEEMPNLSKFPASETIENTFFGFPRVCLINIQKVNLQTSYEEKRF